MVFDINNFNDPRIAAFRNLKDKQLALNQGLFVVEGEFLVRRLLDSSFTVHSILMTDRRYRSGEWRTPVSVPIYLASREIISNIVGFDFHRGVLALGVRPEKQSIFDYADITQIDRLIVCPEINDVENLGSIMRSAAGLEYQHVLLGESCCDPFARRSIRTSMGAVFQLTLFQAQSILQDLRTLKIDFNFEYHASVLNEHAQPLEHVQPPPKTALLFGSEAHGLSEDILELVDQRVTIPMALGTDSLNVGVAAGIFMYHYRKP